MNISVKYLMIKKKLDRICNQIKSRNIFGKFFIISLSFHNGSNEMFMSLKIYIPLESNLGEVHLPFLSLNRRELSFNFIISWKFAITNIVVFWLFIYLHFMAGRGSLLCLKDRNLRAELEYLVWQ